MYRKIQFPLLNQLPSSFDVNSFAAGSFEGEGDTRRLRLEPGEYSAYVVGPFGEEKKTRLRNEKGYLILDVVWQPEDEGMRQTLGVEKLPVVRQSIFLDVTPTGGLDMGKFKNGDLNRLRDVFDLNQPGVKWSFVDFVGKVARIKVDHRPNPNDANNPYVNVTAVTKG